MDIKDFIKNTISSISEAIIESQSELKEKGIIVNPEKTEIGKNGEKNYTVTEQDMFKIWTLTF